MAGEKLQILDKDLGKNLEAKANELREESERKINDVSRAIAKNKYEFEGMVAEHPYAFLIGAFVGGVLVGALLTKRQ